MAKIDEFYLKDVAFDTDYTLTNTGDLATVSGLENVKQALLRRWMTVRGSLIHRPNYGGNLPLYQNASLTIATQRRLAQELAEQSLRDPRVEEILGVQVNVDEQNPSKTTIVVRVNLTGYGEVPVTVTPFGE